MGLHPGALVGSNVRLLRPLSRGGMGSVWRAEHLTLHTEVAVKFVADALIGDAGFLTRFTREAVASARIKSPHAVQIFDHGVTADGQPYIVMELLEGEDLRTRLLRERKLPLATTVSVVTQVARGLARAHAAEIVHRDIKPGNIFLMEQEGELFIKILDFGIAKRIGDVESAVTMTGQIIGTPHYVSPEQIQRPREADPQSDLWSLAVVAYRCLTGELPFEGESVGAVAIAIDKAAFKPVTEREPGLPKMLDEWFRRAFARARSARFGSAKELAVAFEAASRNEPPPTFDPDSASFSLRSATPPPAARAPQPSPPNDAAAGSGAARDATPGGVEGNDTALTEDRTTRPDPREAPAGLSTPALALASAPLAVARPPAIAPEQPATETPHKIDTPLAMGEPTLSHGTVTQIELSHPRRTRLYGAAIAAIAIGGAVTVGLLSRGDDPAPNAAASTPGTAAPELPAASSAATAPPTAAAPATAATGAQPVSSGDAAAADPAPPKATTAPVRSAAPAATGTQTRKRKDRGF